MNKTKFAERLNDLMSNKNDLSPLHREISQTELANYLGITRQAVSSYKLGISEPIASTVVNVARFFNVSTDYLLGLRSDTGNGEHDRDLCERIKRIYVATQRLNDEIIYG